MSVIITPESDLGKELAKWNVRRPPQEFPKMLYKAIKRPNGQYACADPLDEAFAAQCQWIVNDEREQAKAREMGWRHSPVEALEYAEAREQDIAQQAAERAYQDRRLMGKAKEELDAAEHATSEHVLDVPRRPGRPRKDPDA